MEIQCAFKYVDWRDNSNLYTCVVEEAAITKPGTKIEAFVGDHLPQKSSEDVEAFEISNTVVHYFPHGLNVIFPALVAVDIDSCGLKRLERKDLVGLGNLSEFYAGGNVLKKLPDDLFVNMPKLKNISFKGNKQLDSISSELLQPIKDNKLSYVDFREDSTLDAIYEPGRRQSVASLQLLMDSIDEKCKKPVKSSQINCTHAFEKRFVEGFELLFNTGKHSDILINVGQEQLRVHKVLLVSQCKKFDKIFKDDPDKKEITFQDLQPDSVERYIRFLYTGQLCVDSNIVFDLFEIGSPENIPELKKACEIVLTEIIEETNVVNILAIANRCNMKKLKKFAIAEFKKMFPELKVVDEMINKPEEIEKMIEDY